MTGKGKRAQYFRGGVSLRKQYKTLNVEELTPFHLPLDLFIIRLWGLSPDATRFEGPLFKIIEQRNKLHTMANDYDYF